MRLTVSVASNVWSVLKTRCPVSAAERAIWAVSESRISTYYKDDVRVLPQDAPQGPREGGRVRPYLALVDDALLIAVQELYRVLDGDDVLGHLPVDEVDHGRERCGLAAAGDPRDQNYAALFSPQPPYHLRHVQILELGHPKRNETHDDGDRTPLPERVHPETAHPRDRVGEVRLPFLLKRLDNLPRHDVPDHVLRVRRAKDLVTLQALEQTACPDGRWRPHLQVQVATGHLDHLGYQLVYVDLLQHQPLPLYACRNTILLSSRRQLSFSRCQISTQNVPAFYTPHSTRIKASPVKSCQLVTI